MTDWFRSWHGAPTDPKWVLIGRKAGVAPAVASAVAWALFDHASQSSPRGSVTTFDCEVYAAWGGLDDTAVFAVVAAMTERGMIVDGALANWSKRQPEREDNSADRTKAWRDRKKTHENATERTNVIGDAPVTQRDDREDTEERREEKKEASPQSPRPAKAGRVVSYTPAFEIVWDCWPKNANESKKLAFDRFQRLSEEERQDVLDGAMAQSNFLEAEMARRKPGNDPPRIHLSTFISERRWENLLNTEHNRLGRNPWSQQAHH